ncbi:MAG: type II secretion system F family protein [Blautia sp.]|jgi:tight adherence protein C
MKIHVLLLMIFPLLWVARRAGWIPREFLNAKENRRAILILLVGNLMGCMLTIVQNQNLTLGEGSYFMKPKPGEGYQEESLEVLLEDGRSCEMALEIPEQEGEVKETPLPEKKPDLQEEILTEIVRFNEEIQDQQKYYLPDTYAGKRLDWSRKKDTAGILLAMLSLVAAVFAIAAKRKEEQEKEQKRRSQMLLDYPGLVMKLTLLIEAGMPVRRAFQKIARDYKKRKHLQGRRFAYEELTASALEMDNGISEGEAYLRFGERCGEVHYKTLATLLAQNLKKGNQGLLQMLEQESVTAWEDRKRKARVLSEAAATKLLVPMVMMLIIVIAILMIPAFLSFQN